MGSRELISQGLDSDISLAHERFMLAMQGRLPSMTVETKERYFAVLSVLVGKLETSEMPLQQILQEMMSETAAIILQELNSR